GQGRGGGRGKEATPVPDRIVRSISFAQRCATGRAQREASVTPGRPAPRQGYFCVTPTLARKNHASTWKCFQVCVSSPIVKCFEGPQSSSPRGTGKTGTEPLFL
ncbi:unnamed protein product, partial [Discosporangium mesarthrocarpum]